MSFHDPVMIEALPRVKQRTNHAPWYQGGLVFGHPVRLSFAVNNATFSFIVRAFVFASGSSSAAAIGAATVGEDVVAISSCFACDSSSSAAVDIPNYKGGDNRVGVRSLLTLRALFISRNSKGAWWEGVSRLLACGMYGSRFDVTWYSTASSQEVNKRTNEIAMKIHITLALFNIEK